MEKITYGVPGLVDWVAQIKVGAATVNVHFSGGALTAYGVTPAEYTTDNPFLQRVIEQSQYFKSGRIRVQRQQEISEPGRPKEAQPQEAPAKNDNAPTAKAAPLNHGAPEEPQANTAGEVEVTCLQDAQGYLLEKFNIPAYKVRSYEAAQKAAEEHGVRFTGGKFDNAGE